ncbi:MAG: methionyl-tRNA formyltransferase, partial [Actinomycetota bacterium]|nr:methionyl-tRNA formyltransferase [Actinomycetota bacterium]
MVGDGHEVAVVVTRADARRSRRGAPSPSPVKVAAVAMGLVVSHDIGDVISVCADLGVVVAYGRIIRPPVLGSLPLVNVHFSLLPRWRGAAPVERAILAGDPVTGVCLMEVEAGLDTGPVYARAETGVEAGETAAALTARLADLGAALLTDGLAAGLGEPRPQTGEATYAAKLESGDLALGWERPAVELARVVRVGRAWTTWRGQRLLVWEARLSDEAVGGEPGTLNGTTVTAGAGSLRLVRVQPEGRAALDAQDWV